jgi:hypothetical protein
MNTGFMSRPLPADLRGMNIGFPRTVAREEQNSRLRLEEAVLGTGVEFLHNRRIPASLARVEHIAVGHGGVLVIGDPLRRGRRSPFRLAYAIERRASIIREVLAGTPYEAVKVGGVPIGSEAAIARFAARRGPWTVAQIDQIAATIAAGLPAA